MMWEPMLTSAELARELAKVSYRPGWVFSIMEDLHQGPTLRIVAQVEDGYHPGKMLDLGINSRIPDIITEPKQFHRWLLWRVLEIESHEAREYFRVNGELLRDPHQPLPGREVVLTKSLTPL